MSDLAAAFLSMSDDAFDPAAKDMIRKKWDAVPTSLQILEVLDKCIFGGLCTDFLIKALEIMYDQALLAEGKTHADNEPLATWRHT